MFVVAVFLGSMKFGVFRVRRRDARLRGDVLRWVPPLSQFLCLVDVPAALGRRSAVGLGLAMSVEQSLSGLTSAATEVESRGEPDQIL